MKWATIFDVSFIPYRNLLLCIVTLLSFVLYCDVQLCFVLHCCLYINWKVILLIHCIIFPAVYLYHTRFSLKFWHKTLCSDGNFCNWSGNTGNISCVTVFHIKWHLIHLNSLFLCSIIYCICFGKLFGNIPIGISLTDLMYTYVKWAVVSHMPQFLSISKTTCNSLRFIDSVVP